MTMQPIPKFKVTEDANKEGFFILEILDGEYEGVRWTYGEVTFEEDHMTYDLNILDGDVENDTAFKNLTGDILVSIIEEQLKTSDVQYHGGTIGETAPEPEAD